MKRGRQIPAASSKSKGKRTVKPTSRLIAQDDFQQPKSKKKQTKKSMSKSDTLDNSKNDVEESLGEISAESNVDTAQTSASPKIIKSDEIISAAKELEISMSDAEEEIKNMKIEPDVLNRTTVWAQIHAKNDILFQKKLCLLYFRNLIKIPKADPKNLWCSTIAEQSTLEELISKRVKNKEYFVCVDSFDPYVRFNAMQLLLRDFTNIGLDYLIADAYAVRARECGEELQTKWAKIDIPAAMNRSIERRQEFELYHGDLRIAMARIKASFARPNSCNIVKAAIDRLASDPEATIKYIVNQLGNNAFQPDPSAMEPIISRVKFELSQIFNRIKPWDLSIFYEQLVDHFRLLNSIPNELWEGEIMCTLNQAVYDLNQSKVERPQIEFQRLATFRDELMRDYGLNIGKPGCGRVFEDDQLVFKAPCTSHKFLSTVATILAKTPTHRSARRADYAQANQLDASSQPSGAGGSCLGKRQRGQGSQGQGAQTQSRPEVNARRPPTCYRCHRLGHISRECKAIRNKDGHPLPVMPNRYQSMSKPKETAPPCDVKAIEDEFHSKIINSGFDEDEWKNLSKDYSATAGAAIDRLVAENEKYRTRVDELESQCARAPFKRRKTSNLKGGQSLQVHLVDSSNKTCRKNNKRRKRQQMQGEGCSAAARNPRNDGPGPSGGSGGAGNPGGPGRGGSRNKRRGRGTSGRGAYRAKLGGAPRAPNAYRYLNLSSVLYAIFCIITVTAAGFPPPAHNTSSMPQLSLNAPIKLENIFLPEMLAFDQISGNSTHYPTVGTLCANTCVTMVSLLKQVSQAVVNAYYMWTAGGVATLKPPWEVPLDPRTITAQRRGGDKPSNVCATPHEVMFQYEFASVATPRTCYSWWHFHAKLRLLTSEPTDAFAYDRVPITHKHRKRRRLFSPPNDRLRCLCAMLFGYMMLLVIWMISDGQMNLPTTECLVWSVKSFIALYHPFMVLPFIRFIMWTIRQIVLLPVRIIRSFILLFQIGIYFVCLLPSLRHFIKARRKRIRQFEVIHRHHYRQQRNVERRRARVIRQVARTYVKRLARTEDIALRYRNNRAIALELLNGVENDPEVIAAVRGSHIYDPRIAAARDPSVSDAAQYLFAMDDSNPENMGCFLPKENRDGVQTFKEEFARHADEFEQAVQRERELELNISPRPLRNLVSAEGRQYIYDALAHLPVSAFYSISSVIRPISYNSDPSRTKARRGEWLSASFLIDSGSNIPAVLTPEVLFHPRSTELPVRTASANQDPMIATYVGRVITPRFMIPDVRYLPTLSSFILSTYALNSVGWKVVLDTNEGYMENHDTHERIYFRMQNRLWYLDIEIKIAPDDSLKQLHSEDNINGGPSHRCAPPPQPSSTASSHRGAYKRARDGSSDTARPPGTSGVPGGVPEEADPGYDTDPSDQPAKRSCPRSPRKPQPPSPQVLHNRFHACWGLLRRLAGKVIYDQDSDGNELLLPEDWKYSRPPKGCEPCFRAKSRIRYGKPSRKTYTTRGECVVVDMFYIGSTGSPTLGGNLYATVFVDVATRLVTVYLHKTRRERLYMFKHYIAFCKSFGVTIQAFRTDPAGEWLCSSLKQYFIKKGIRHEVVPPRQQSANGIAERCIGLLKTYARAFMLDSQAPHVYWGYAVLYAAEVLNILPRVPARLVHGNYFYAPNRSEIYASAHQLFYHKVPNISHFRRFGSIAYPHLDKQVLRQRGAHPWLSARADKGMYVGVHNNGRSQIVVIPQRGHFAFFTTSCCNTESTMYYSPTNTQGHSATAAASHGPPTTIFSRTSPTQQDYIGDQPVTSDDDSSDDGKGAEKETHDYPIHSPDELRRKLDAADDVALSDDEDEPNDENLEERRRSTRVRQPRSFFKPSFTVKSLRDVLSCNCIRCKIAAVQGASIAPSVIKYNFDKVRNDPKLWAIWKEYCYAEWAQFLEPGRSEWGIPAEGDSKIPTFWLLLEHYNDAHHLIKRKARLITRGDLISAENNDYDFAFSATASYDQVRLLAALSAASEKDLFTGDVRGAYLSVHRTTEPGHKPLWIIPPKGFENPENPNFRLKALCAFYGLRDSGRRWWYKMRQALEAIRFTTVDFNPCFYVRQPGKNLAVPSDSTSARDLPNIHSPRYAALALYVDDVLVLSSQKEFEQIIRELKLQDIDVNKSGPAKKFLGIDIRIRITRSSKEGEACQLVYDNINELAQCPPGEHMSRPRVDVNISAGEIGKTVTLTQEQYITDTFVDSGVPEAPCVCTPVPKGWVIDRRDMPAEPNQADVKYFRRIYGKVLHIARCTRPDIAYSCSELGRVSGSPSPEHVKMLKRVVQYLYNTRGLGLRYGGAKVRQARDQRNRIKVQIMHDFNPAAYADASFGDDPADRRSMSGYIIFLNGAPIAWRSKRQSFAVGSTCESEIMALSSIVKEVQALTRALADLGFVDDNPPIVYEDNQCCISHSNDDNSLGRTKALDLRFANARQAVQRKIIRLRKISSRDQLADFMCKQPEKGTFINLRNAILGMSVADTPESTRRNGKRVHCNRPDCTCSEELDGAATRRAIAAREKVCPRCAACTKNEQEPSSVPDTSSRAQENMGARASPGANGARARADDIRTRAGARARVGARAHADDARADAPGARGLAVGARAGANGAHACAERTYATPTLPNGANMRAAGGAHESAGDVRALAGAHAYFHIGGAPACADQPSVTTHCPRARVSKPQQPNNPCDGARGTDGARGVSVPRARTNGARGAGVPRARTDDARGVGVPHVRTVAWAQGDRGVLRVHLALDK